jgi:hypothetical protein
MNACPEITRDMLGNPIEISTGMTKLDFSSAKRMAYEAASKVTSEPMLLAWWDRNGRTFSPDACCSADKPGWLIYAETRGGNVSVDINDEEFVFVYRSGLTAL